MDRQEWLKWRQAGIGSSDAPAIHGKSSWNTPLKIFRDKKETEYKEQESNWAMDVGNAIEPILRMKFAKILSHELGGMHIEFQSKNIEMPELPFMRSSFDGFTELNLIGRIGMEAKFMGAAKMQQVKNAGPDAPFQGLPEEYWIQMQHQFFVGNLNLHFFVATNEPKPELIMDENIVRVNVRRDDEFIRNHLKLCTKFWNGVQKNKPPKPMKGDVVAVKKKGSIGVAKKYKKLLAQSNVVDKQLKETREKLLTFCEFDKQVIEGLSITKVDKVGSVDYAKIPELKGIDLDKYRKAGSSSWMIKPLGKKDDNQSADQSA